jgi:uncharacterized membrane protein HdeD (DUF308 family)
MKGLFQTYWWTFVLRGICFIGIGAILLMNLFSERAPGGYIFAGYLLLEGIFCLILVFGKVGISEVWTFIVKGCTSLVLGIIYLLWPLLISIIWPGLGISLRVFFISVWAAVTGIAGIVELMRYPKGRPERWTLFVGSVLALMLAAVLALRQQSGMLSLLWILTIFSFGIGTCLTLFGIQCRRARHALDN